MSLYRSVDIRTYRITVYGLLLFCIILLLILVGALSQAQQRTGADTTSPTRRINAGYTVEETPQFRCVNGEWIPLDEAIGIDVENIEPSASLDCGEPQ